MGRDVVELTAMVDAVCSDLNKFCGDLNKGIKQKLEGQPLDDLCARARRKIQDYEELLAKLEDTYRRQVEDESGDFIEIARGFLARLEKMREGNG